MFSFYQLKSNLGISHNEYPIRCRKGSQGKSPVFLWGGSRREKETKRGQQSIEYSLLLGWGIRKFKTIFSGIILVIVILFVHCVRGSWGPLRGVSVFAWTSRWRLPIARPKSPGRIKVILAYVPMCYPWKHSWHWWAGPPRHLQIDPVLPILLALWAQRARSILKVTSCDRKLV